MAEIIDFETYKDKNREEQHSDKMVKATYYFLCMTLLFRLVYLIQNKINRIARIRFRHDIYNLGIPKILKICLSNIQSEVS